MFDWSRTARIRRIGCAMLLILSLIVSMCAASAGPGSIQIGDVELTLTALGYDPFLYPPDMADDQIPLSLVFSPRSGLPSDELIPSYEAFFKSARLMDAAGTVYAPGLLLAPKDSGGGTILGGSGKIGGGKDDFPGMACLIFALPKGIHFSELTLKVLTSSDLHSIRLDYFSSSADAGQIVPQIDMPTLTPAPQEAGKAAQANSPLDAAYLLSMPYPATDLEFDIAPYHFHLTTALDSPPHSPENRLNYLPACMLGFDFGANFGDGSLDARLAVYNAATLLAQDGKEYRVFSSGAHENERWDLYFGLPEEKKPIRPSVCSNNDSQIFL